MRRAARVDENQPEIVAALRLAGVCVQPLHAVGDGCPDLLCGYRGRNILIEIKNPEADPCKRRLTPDQVDWHAHWLGEVHVVLTAEEAINAIRGTEYDQ